MKKSFEKVFKVFCITAMVIMNFSNGLFTIAEAKSGPDDGQVEYVGGEKSTPSGYTYEISGSKTIEAVKGKENYFDITLQTKTKRYRVDTSTDVVIVLDISNTMNSDALGNSENVAYTDMKLSQAKAAINYFIGEYAGDTKLDLNRKVAVVTFNSDANVVVGLSKANDLSLVDDIYAKVNDITAPGIDSERRFTNIEAGLKLAQNILDTQSTARFKFIILLTDGFPTTYIQSGSSSTTSITGYSTIMGTPHSNYDETRAEKAEDGYFANTKEKVQCDEGTSYSNKAALKAESVAKNIKDSGINIFTVGIALKSQSISDFPAYIIDTTGMAENEAYAIGNTTETYKHWLENKIAGGNLIANNKYADGASLSELEKGYANIMKEIEAVPDTTMMEFYTIDPMSDVVDFISFYDKDGNLATNPISLIGKSKQNAENTATYNTTTQTINWNMLESGYTMDGDYLVFTLKYRIRLKNEVSSFAWSTAYNANKKTTLYYSQKYSESGKDVPDGTGTLDYPIPQIEGYCGQLMFKKVNKTTQEPIAGIEFILQHDKECSVCEGDATIADMKVSSDVNGIVSFTNIPSGHEYSLIEAETARFAPIASHSVTVSYGKTYVDGTGNEHLLENGQFKDGTAWVIENTETKLIELQIQITKKQDGTTPALNAYRFTLNGTAPSGTVNETVSNDENGLATFSTLTFNKTGTYHLKVIEEVGDKSNIIYDKTEHTIEIQALKDDTGLNYQVIVSVDGKAAQTYSAKENSVVTIDAGEFNNRTRQNASVSLTAKKTLTGRTLKADEFSFALANSDGEVIQIKKNKADGSILFDDIQFMEEGIYNYQLYEVKENLAYVHYDETVYSIMITVDKDLQGNYQANVKINDEDYQPEQKQLVFENSYKSNPASVIISGTKFFLDTKNNAKTLKGNEFTFYLKDQGNLVIDEVKNTADGSFSFKELAYNRAGTYQYTVVEKVGKGNINYDRSIYHITVIVEEDGYGNTQITNVLKTKNNQSVEKIEFVNKVNVVDTSDTAQALKWNGFMAASGLMMILMTYLRRRTHQL